MKSIKQIDGYKIYLSQLLGKGSFGDVYVGISDTNGQKYAVKILNKLKIDVDQYQKNALFSQIRIMQLIQSQNVVGFCDVMQSSKNYYIIQQLCDGTLSQIMKPGQIIPQKKAKQYLQQIANGFLSLVKAGVIHRDVKPANILLKGDTIKIGDFGLSKTSEKLSKAMNQTIVGTPLYMSLQVLKGQQYSSKCDIWAVGCIYYQMLHGRSPWYANTQYDLANKISGQALKIKADVSSESKDFLKKCLGITEHERMSWNQFFVHPIFNGHFIKQKDKNNQYENKLKMIMSDLRFQINSKNIDLTKILASLGYKSGKNELNKTKFHEFLKIISPSVTKQASDYIFKKVDIDNNGTISINQIQQTMRQNSIMISTLNKYIPGIFKKQDNKQTFDVISLSTTNKIKQCFSKLMNDISLSICTIDSLFNKFGQSWKGNLNKQEFKNMLKFIYKDLTNQQIQSIFDSIDVTHSKYVSLKQFNTYYNKINSIADIPTHQQEKSQKQQSPKKSPMRKNKSSKQKSNNQIMNPFQTLLNNGYNPQQQFAPYQQPQFQPPPYQQPFQPPYQPSYQQPYQPYPPPPYNFNPHQLTFDMLLNGFQPNYNRTNSNHT